MQDLHKTERKVRQLAETGRDVGEEIFLDGQESLSDIKSKGRAAWNEAKEKSKWVVRRHPFQTAGYALLIGLVAGAAIFLSCRKAEK